MTHLERSPGHDDLMAERGVGRVADDTLLGALLRVRAFLEGGNELDESWHPLHEQVTLAIVRCVAAEASWAAWAARSG